MNTITLNMLYIYVLPALVGIAVRVLMNRFKRSWLATAVLGILTLIAWGIWLFNPIPGSELFGILALQVSIAFAASLLTGVILNCLGHY